MIFAKLQHRVHHAAAHHAKIARAVYKLRVRDAVDDAVKRAGKRAANLRLALSRDAAGGDAVAVLVVQALQHLAYHLRRVLQIAVHHADEVAFCVFQPRIHRGLFAEIARKGDVFHARVLCSEFTQDGQRFVL